MFPSPLGALLPWCSQSVQRPPHQNLTPPFKATNRPLMNPMRTYLLSCLQWPWQHSQSRSNWKPAPWVQNLGCWEGYQLCPSQDWMWPQTDSWLTAQQTHLSVYHTLGDLASAWPARGNTWEKDYKKRLAENLSSELHNAFVQKVTQKNNDSLLLQKRRKCKKNHRMIVSWKTEWMEVQRSSSPFSSFKIASSKPNPFSTDICLSFLLVCS